MKKLISNLKRMKKIDKYTFVYANNIALYKVMLEISQCSDDFESVKTLRKILLHELYFSYLFLDNAKNKSLAEDFMVIRKTGIEINYFLEEYLKDSRFKFNLEKARNIANRFCLDNSESFERWEEYITEFLRVSKIRMTLLVILLIIILSSGPFITKFIYDAFDMSEIGNEELEENYFFLDGDIVIEDDTSEYLEDNNLIRKLEK